MKVIEQFRRDWPMATEILKLESRLWQLAIREQLRVVLVSSALRGEGKSTTVAYLATALALHPGRKILVLDLDFRHPSVNRHFEVEVKAGLADALMGKCHPQDTIIRTDLPELDLMLPCRDGESADPALLHDTVKLHWLFNALRVSYDLILVDAPALVPVADAAALVPLSDGVVLMAMAGLTTKHHLNRARDLCLGMGARILGLVVGNVQEAAPEYLDASYYHGYARVKHPLREAES
jgi:capsular exopolysaccharide synthesis family protein